MLAGKMRLNMFLLLVGVLIAAGIAVGVKACQSMPSKTTPSVKPTPTPPTPTPTPTPQPEVASPEVKPAPPSDLPARAWDAEVIAWKDKSIGGDKVKDAIKGKSYKVNLYKDAGQTNVNRAKVDVDRDDKWDEKFTFEPGKITLQRAPADDEKYTETYHWSGSGWTRE